MRIARHGALAVVEQAHPKDAVQRRLKELDNRLFLEKQMTLTNEEVWCVVVDVGLDHPPITLLEWRDDEGRPIDYLSDRIVARIAAFERDAGKLLARVVEENARKVERARREADENYETVIKETAKFAHPMHAGLLPRRGVGEKARARRLLEEQARERLTEYIEEWKARLR